MKKLLSGLVLANVLLVGAAQAHADGSFVPQSEFANRARNAETLAERVKRVNTYRTKVDKMHFNNGEWERRSPTVQIPELDANAAGAALALLVGGALVLVDRKKKRVAV